MTVKTRGEQITLIPYWYEATCGGSRVSLEKLGPSTWESISYEKPQFERYGDCIHVRRKVNVTHATCEGDGACSDTSYAPRIFFPLSEQTNEGFNARAFSAMKPRINPVIQLPVELKELVTGWKELLKPFGLDSSSLSKVGSTNLWYQFGIAPTIGGIQDTYEALLKFEERLNDFLRLQGKELTSHYREEIENPEVTETMDEQLSGNRYHAYSVVCKHTTIWTATMKYRYKIPGISEMHDALIRLKAYGDMLGFSSSLAMAWEMVPFSFVIDWFLNVGDFISQFDEPYLDTEVEVIDYCISQKTSRTSRTYMGRGEQGNEVLAGTHYEQLYMRTRCLPNYDKFGIRESDNFGTRQMLLGLSLLVA